jgi:hypothetical protein
VTEACPTAAHAVSRSLRVKKPRACMPRGAKKVGRDALFH